MSEFDGKGLFQFLAQTPEKGLRKMLVDNKPMTEAHFNLLLKIVRAGDEGHFCEHFDKKDFPKVKMGPAEQKIKEKFWDECITTFKARGILQPAMPQKIAA
jgi:hypothetical protein